MTLPLFSMGRSANAFVGIQDGDLDLGAAHWSDTDRLVESVRNALGSLNPFRMGPRGRSRPEKCIDRSRADIHYEKRIWPQAALCRCWGPRVRRVRNRIFEWRSKREPRMATEFRSSWVEVRRLLSVLPLNYSDSWFGSHTRISSPFRQVFSSEGDRGGGKAEARTPPVPRFIYPLIGSLRLPLVLV